MLRIVVLLLVLANAGFYSWRQGWLDTAVGVPAQGDREPGRLAAQVTPEMVRVLAPLPAENAANEPTTCLEIGPYSPGQLSTAEAALQTVLTPGTWVDRNADAVPIWIVFMGPYAEPEQREKKTDELKRLDVAYEDVRNVPELGEGLALGRFDDRAAAERAVDELNAKGVRTGRVVLLSPGTTSHYLRVEQADAALQGRLQSLNLSGLHGRNFLPCKS